MKKIINSPFDRRDVWAYYHSVYLPSITYSFPSTNILTNALHSMRSVIKSTILPKYGFNQNKSSAVVYESYLDTGVDLCNLLVEKGIAQLNHFLMALH